MARQDRSNWEIAICTITPAKAKKMFSLTGRNRSIREKLVNTYADDMRDGRWVLTPEPIIIDKDGGVLDGQHRLQAVIDTNVARKFFVVSNVDPSLIDVLGIGRSRSAPDILKIDGEKNTSVLATAARALYHYQTIPQTNTWNSPSRPLSSPGVLEVLREHPQLRDCVDIGSRLASRLKASPGAIVVAVYLTSRVIPLDQQGEWLEPLESGVGLERGSPVLTLREFYRNKQKAFTPQGRLRAHLAAYLYAWKDWHHDELMPRMKDLATMPDPDSL